jgi:hypothetical protein
VKSSIRDAKKIHTMKISIIIPRYNAGRKIVRAFRAQKIADKIVSERLRELQNDPKFLFDICLSYRHDFRLLPTEFQESINFQAKEWLRSIRNNLKSRQP